LEKKRAPASGRGEGTSANVAREMGGERRAQSREATVSERERERERKKKKSPIKLVEFYPKLSVRPSLSFSPHPLPLSPFRHLQSFILYLSLVLSTSQPLYLHSYVHLLFFYLLSRPIVCLLLSFLSQYYNSLWLLPDIE